MSQVQFYRAVIILGGNTFPVLPGARFTCPKNYAVPPIIGNRWQLNKQEGFRQPVVDLSFVVFDDPAGVLGLTFLNYFLTRTNDYADDTSLLGNGSLTFYDGYTTIVMNGLKADSFSIGTSKGDDLRVSARFCGSSINVTTGTPGTSPAFSGWANTPLLRFQSVNFTNTPYQNSIFNFNLSYSNNHTPNMALNGSSFPIEENAGFLSVAFSAMCQALPGVGQTNIFVDNGIDWTTGAGYGNVESGTAQLGTGTYAAPQAITFTVTGNNLGTRNFSLNNPVLNSPDERAVSMPRVMRSLSYICTGLNGLSIPPLTIS